VTPLDEEPVHFASLLHRYAEIDPQWRGKKQAGSVLVLTRMAGNV